MQLQLQKKSFQEKKLQSCKIFTASHKLQISNGGNKDAPKLCLHCCKYLNPPSRSQAPLSGGKKKCGRLGHLEPHNRERNFICFAIALTCIRLRLKVLETSWAFVSLIFISFQMQLKKLSPQIQTKSSSLLTKIRRRQAKCNSPKISAKQCQFLS